MTRPARTPHDIECWLTDTRAQAPPDQTPPSAIMAVIVQQMRFRIGA